MGGTEGGGLGGLVLGAVVGGRVQGTPSLGSKTVAAMPGAVGWPNVAAAADLSASASAGAGAELGSAGSVSPASQLKMGSLAAKRYAGGLQ